jgi:hypothetical protein
MAYAGYVVMRCKFILATALALLSLGASAQVTKVGEAYQIRKLLRIGDSASYIFSQNPTNSDVMATPSTLPVVSKTIALTGNLAKVQYIFTPNTKFARIHQLSVDRFNQSIGGYPFLSFGDIHYPSTAVKIGQTWIQPIAHPLFGKATNLKLTFKGFRNLGKLKIADINCAVSAQTAEGLIKGSGTYSIRVTDGSLDSIKWSESIALPDKSNAYRTRRMTNSIVLTRN